MFKCASARRAEDIGPEYADVADTSVDYASLLRNTGRTFEAASIERHGAMIRQKAATCGSSE